MIGDTEYVGLIAILKIFKNRPYHLAKYLLDNNALDPIFIKKISGNKKLSDIESKIPHFSDINQMNKYFNNLLIEFSIGEDVENLRDVLNAKLQQSIKDELYEEAIQIRDYMIHNKIDRYL